MTDQIIFEPIGVADRDFHVMKSIDQCPPGLMLRELLQNAFEAPATDDEEGERKVIMRAKKVDGVPKLTIFNTGQGMSPEELKAATDLASSIRKAKGLDGRQNRGEGAKVASLPWNHLGLRMRSCSDGKVSEVLLRRLDNQYVRERLPVSDDDGLESYEAVWDVTESCKKEGYNTGQDWTEVTLFGSDVNQDTTRWPYGQEIGSGDRRAALTEVFNRFYDFPESANVYASDALHGRKSVMELRPMARVIDRWKSDPSVLRIERVTGSDGIVIDYVHTPLLSGNNNVFGRHELTGDATRIALVWQNEMYGARIGPNWRHDAASYGVPYVHRELSIFIHLPDDFAVRDSAYRQRLERVDTGEELECRDFGQDVRALMPRWVRDLVERAIAPKQATNMSEVEKELAARLRRARVRRVETKPSGGLTVVAEGQEDDSGSPDDANATANEPTVDTVLDPEANPDPVGERPRTLREPSRKAKAAKRISAAPKIEWLDKEELVEAEELTSRAAKYVRETNVLYMNQLHEAVAGKIRELEEHYRPQLDLEAVAGMIIDHVRVQMALHVGTSVVHALAKEGSRDWTTEQIETAFSPETLTVVAENSDHLVGNIRQRLSTTSVFKAARAL